MKANNLLLDLNVHSLRHTNASLLIARGTGCSNLPLLLPHKIRAKQKEQHPIRCCSWCDREDSNLWPSGSENYDTAHNSMICSNFLSVLHSGSQNKKKPLVGCHNRLFRSFEGMLHSSGQMVVKIQTIYFFKEKAFAIWGLDNTILAEKTLYSR